ncbi:Nucleotide-binding universal stress protein, UspA family [Saccharicrinis carchari]|uniref:Nucleotide-binding universal stress protein, UspA family n=1 Tax=Saccharicrinis carchari TaxID=1168039 RepID=A0A521CJT9_SACCC|nr:universal stress protein [Saccharicrinis carchari]SMO59001.1 Nucleotide-binding universal stress protein, UspA family [Saccharicrinis carchari]
MIKFLIPINFAPYTINAVNYCRALVNRVKGEITLLYCYTKVVGENSEARVNKINSREDALAELQKLKKHILDSLPEKDNISVNMRVIDGYPEDVIVKFSEEYRPDLIVMGTKSKGETIKELLGSVTFDVIKKVSFPVMAVPNDYKLNIDKLTNILFINDFENCEYTSLHKLVRLVGAFDTKIHNVQHCPHGKDKIDPKLMKEYTEYMHSTYRNQNMICDYICDDDLIVSTQEYIDAHNIDLMAITRRKRNIISQILQPSRTKKILFNAEIPTLFFHQ